VKTGFQKRTKNNERNCNGNLKQSGLKMKNTLKIKILKILKYYPFRQNVTRVPDFKIFQKCILEYVSTVEYKYSIIEFTATSDNCKFYRNRLQIQKLHQYKIMIKMKIFKKKTRKNILTKISKFSKNILTKYTKKYSDKNCKIFKKYSEKNFQKNIQTKIAKFSKNILTKILKLSRNIVTKVSKNI